MSSGKQPAKVQPAAEFSVDKIRNRKKDTGGRIGRKKTLWTNAVREKSDFHIVEHPQNLGTITKDKCNLWKAKNNLRRADLSKSGKVGMQFARTVTQDSVKRKQQKIVFAPNGKKPDPVFHDLSCEYASVVLRQ